MSRTMCEKIFTQASFIPPVWDLACSVIEMFENGQLKNQKLSKKNLVAKPEFKQHHFQCLHNLPVAVLCIDVAKEDFVERLKDSYQYEVLGGQHTIAAKSELLKEDPNNRLYNQALTKV